MSLTPGARLGPYEVTAQIGVGGMGEVYRARDTKLGRDVALKILPDAFAQDADRLARFRREAHVLASLNHPGIAHIYGLEDADGTHALVMELVEGPTLADRIERGPIPVDEALPIAKQIADALEAAHEQGIVHRDLKPANVKAREDGTVKVLDFGLAKALVPDSASASAGGSTSASMSPTITSPAMTEMGMILGTAAYMSPEQARGRAVDKRADIWGFGCVLFEMLAGRRLFSGDTLSDTLAAVLTREPAWTMLPASTPQGVLRLLARCLERDPRMRLRDIGDARPDLEDVGSARRPSASARNRPLARALPWGLTAVLLVFAGWAFWSRPDAGGIAGNPTYADMALPADVEPVSFAPQIAPDGRTIAFAGAKDGVRHLFLRGLDGADITEVSAGGGINSIAFSPDSRNLAFVSVSGELMVYSLIDHSTRVLTGGADPQTAPAWGPAGIVFGRAGALWILPAEGGDPRRLTSLDAARGEVLHNHSIVLPGGRFVLFSSLTAPAGTERIEAVSIDSGSRSVVAERAISPVWSPTGHLLFVRDGALVAARLDPQTARVEGEAVPVLPSGVVGSDATGKLLLSLSSTGTLLYAPVGLLENRAVSVGRDGGVLALGLPSGEYANPRLSPDGRRLLVEDGARFLEVLDLMRGTRAELTAAGLGTAFATWTSDGKRVVARRLGIPAWIAADGSGESAALPGGSTNDYPTSPGPDPDSVLVVRVDPDTTGDIFQMSLSGAFQPRSLLATPAYDGGPQLSPDGHWLLYQSNPSGQAAIFVRRYPGLDRPYPVSSGGGVQARWSRTGHEIYYRNDRHMVAVSVDTSGAEPIFGSPTPLFADEYRLRFGYQYSELRCHV